MRTYQVPGVQGDCLGGCEAEWEGATVCFEGVPGVQGDCLRGREAELGGANVCFDGVPGGRILVENHEPSNPVLIVSICPADRLADRSTQLRLDC